MTCSRQTTKYIDITPATEPIHTFNMDAQQYQSTAYYTVDQNYGDSYHPTTNNLKQFTALPEK